ncbi:twin-arginine translocase subunit TatC [Luteolibacter sp. GHJ8]|uniref:Sec-independent protein translocase protein TatC n=1 Tax=Luteolibacter rhizosphaerae TaxID=2989719 RepID=A0ABT3FXG7_9BACT|nr:twin-arginine translocase subunit TatC [Luteolibacter rhizosphaerae]MCW1912277.1 twin-arginine translocase subunit TatC [Luteolibacter rhizosphaerae]
MFLLNKVFQLRDKANPDLEKPFLEHLEDLRVMITRTVVTLMVSMVVCFAFQDKLMDLLREPVDQVTQIHASKLLPSDITPANWEAAKKIEHAAVSLGMERSGVFLDQFDADTLRRVELVRLLRAIAALPEANRKPFLEKAATPEFGAIVTEMLVKGASPEIDVRGNLQLMSALKPTETFMLSMKLSFFAGIVVAFPLLLLYVLQFVLPGLHTHEQKVLWPALAIGFGLFLIGVCFAYFFVLPRALTFFYEWSAQLGVSNDWRIGEYITFATQFTLLFGLSFELPVVVMVFVKIGLLTHEAMRRTRSYAILAIFVVAAIITPTPDAFTLCLMAGPMCLLYELCIWLSYFDAKKAEQAEREEERQRMERLLLDSDSHEKGEEEDRSDHWDPSNNEDGWKAGSESATEGEALSEEPPQSIPDEERRRMSDLGGENK